MIVYPRRRTHTSINLTSFSSESMADLLMINPCADLVHNFTQSIDASWQDDHPKAVGMGYESVGSRFRTAREVCRL